MNELYNHWLDLLVHDNAYAIYLVIFIILSCLSPIGIFIGDWLKYKRQIRQEKIKALQLENELREHRISATDRLKDLTIGDLK